jgi:hypothetical protein
MRSCRAEHKVFEELLHWGTSLDETILENSRVASLGLEITQTGSGIDNVAFVPVSPQKKTSVTRNNS